jgi:hypothetical protein
MEGIMRTATFVLGLSATVAAPAMAADPASIDWSKISAVHDDNITTRGHHVSFVKTLGFGTKADIQAVKLP